MTPTHPNLSNRTRTVSAAFAMMASAALLFPTASTATSVLIDLGDNFSDLTASNWNTVQFTQTVPNLIDENGAPSGISFAPLFWGGDFQNSANWIQDKDWVLKSAATDHFGGFSNSTITFGGLSDPAYNIEVVVAHPQQQQSTATRSSFMRPASRPPSPFALPGATSPRQT